MQNRIISTPFEAGLGQPEREIGLLPRPAGGSRSSARAATDIITALKAVHSLGLFVVVRCIRFFVERNFFSSLLWFSVQKRDIMISRTRWRKKGARCAYFVVPLPKQVFSKCSCLNKHVWTACGTHTTVFDHPACFLVRITFSDISAVLMPAVGDCSHDRDHKNH